LALHPASDPDGNPEFMSGIGELCAAWSYFEFITDRIIWRLLQVSPIIGSMITANKDLNARWGIIANHAAPHVTEVELAIFQRINSLLATVSADRNIAVHGQIAKDNKSKKFFAVVTRGRHANKYNNIDLPKIKTITANIKLLSVTATNMANDRDWLEDLPEPTEYNNDWAVPIEGFP
jgi:hypothetical protein